MCNDLTADVNTQGSTPVSQFFMQKGRSAVKSFGILLAVFSLSFGLSFGCYVSAYAAEVETETEVETDVKTDVETNVETKKETKEAIKIVDNSQESTAKIEDDNHEKKSSSDSTETKGTGAIAGANLAIACAFSSDDNSTNSKTSAGATAEIGKIIVETVTINSQIVEQQNEEQRKLEEEQKRLEEEQLKQEEEQKRFEEEQRKQEEEQKKNEEEQRKLDVWPHTDAEWDLLYAIVRQEAGENEDGAWAVIQSAYNRTQDPVWSAMYGTTIIEQLRAPSQYTYGIDGLHARYLNGNYGDAVVNGVQHCVDGDRRHYYTSFRTTGSYEAASIQGEKQDIGGNTFFSPIKK